MYAHSSRYTAEVFYILPVISLDVDVVGGGRAGGARVALGKGQMTRNQAS